ncbi:MAG: hypothetical protein LBO09_06045 [Candidatus Peribacteria bacterium]|jgi:DNA mismatch repair ATPase MutS|nr:hypothetical protein [Candidatus Peribacteria bacterium]
MKTYYECWQSLKNYPENKNRILFFSSGVFFKTFETDAEFLSAKFGFKVIIKGGYSTVGFPHQSEVKYLSQLQEENYSYQLLKQENGEIVLIDEFEGESPLSYEVEQIVYREKKKPEIPTEESPRFTSFLLELSQLIQKYLP